MYFIPHVPFHFTRGPRQRMAELSEMIGMFLKLIKKFYFTGMEQADVVNAILNHCNPFNTHSKCKARINRWINSTRT